MNVKVLLSATLILLTNTGLLKYPKEPINYNSIYSSPTSSYSEIASEGKLYERDISNSGNGNVTATLYNDGRLVISGTGEMRGLSSVDNPLDSGIIPKEYKDRVTSVEIQEGITNIARESFYHLLNLTTVTIASTVKSIGFFSFMACQNLETINIPASVESISVYAFEGCSKLNTITVDANNKYYSGSNGVLFNKNSTTIVYYPNGKTETSYTLPATVEVIGTNAFSSRQYLTDIILSNSVTKIEDYAFDSCDKLTTIQIPASVTSITHYAFSHCSKLTSINVDSGNSSYCSVDGILYDKGITNMLYYPEAKPDTSYSFPSTVEQSESISNPYLKDLHILENLSEFSGIEDCPSLSIITVSENNASYSAIDNVLYDKDITKILFYPPKRENTTYMIPKTVNDIMTESFVDVSDVKIIIPATVTSISPSAFINCLNFTVLLEDENLLNSNRDGFFNNRNHFIFYCRSSNNNIRELAETSTRKSLEILQKVINEKISSLQAEGKRVEQVSDPEVPELDPAYDPSNYTRYLGNLKYEYWLKIYDSLQEDNDTYTVSGFLVDIADDYFKDSNDFVEMVIDDDAPTISSISGNPTQWTKDNVVITVNAEDTLAGLAAEPYSFDNGNTWQAENIKTYQENTADIVVKVKDAIGNIQTAESFDISKIIELQSISVKQNPTKLNYLLGDTLDTTGLILTATYNNEIKDITTGFTCNPTTLQNIGEQIITVTYEGKNTTFKVNVEKPSSDVSSNIYTITDKYIDRIQPETTIQTLKNNISTNAKNIKITKNNKEVSDSETISTGMVITFDDNLSYILIVTGDCNSDGNADIEDILLINKYRLNKGNLSDSALLAGDINKDSIVNIQDILQLNKFRLKKISTL